MANIRFIELAGILPSIYYDIISRKHLTPSSPSAPSSASVEQAITMAEDCTTSPEFGLNPPDAANPPAAVTIIGESKSEEWTILICRGGGAVAPPAPPPLGLACSGGGAWACTICWRRGGGGVFCICWSGGGCRVDNTVLLDTTITPDGDVCCLMMILVTVGGLGARAGVGVGGLCAPVRERVVT